MIKLYIMPKKILTKKFFSRSALVIAKELLGKFLVRRIGKKKISVIIIETEAYIGLHDKASHASRGRTARNKPMWGEAGNFYVYFTYGIHWMLNVVADKKDYPAAVLIRGGKWKIENGEWADIKGPARLTKFLKIDKRFNGKPANRKIGLWFEDRGIKVKPSQIKQGPRIGVDYAGKWANKPYNFRLN